MAEKFKEDEPRDNSVEYNALVSACRVAYPGKSGREVSQEAQSIWSKLKKRYVMGMLFIHNLNFDKC